MDLVIVIREVNTFYVISNLKIFIPRGLAIKPINALFTASAKGSHAFLFLLTTSVTVGSKNFSKFVLDNLAFKSDSFLKRKNIISM